MSASRSRSISRGSAHYSASPAGRRSRSASRSRSPPRHRGASASRSRSRGRQRSRSGSPVRGSRLAATNDTEVRNPGNQIYVSGLSPHCTHSDLRQRFEKHGEIEEASVVNDPHHNECRGFGFVRFRTTEEADEAIRMEHGAQFMGNVLTVQPSRRNCPRPKTPGEYLGRNTERYDYRRESRPRSRSRRGSPYHRRDYGRSDSRHRRSDYGARSDSRHRRDRRDRDDYSRRDDRYERRRDRDYPRH